MDRLNYFNSYQSKEDWHEDKLTRAYLVLLKHSFHAFATFFDYCRSKQDFVKDEKQFFLPELVEEGWDIETQRGNPEINTNWLLSVLITDATMQASESAINPDERNARYDGIISFGSSLTLLIENKPRSGNVWFGQLNPSKENLSDETLIYKKPALLEWKEILRHLNHLTELPTISGYEKIMIEDFLEYVNTHFAYLNPYDRFDMCKGNPELIERRISYLLRSIVRDEGIVQYHHGWGYVIKTPYQEISQIGLVLEKDANSWWLDLNLFFGDTQRQAASFYGANPVIDHLNQNWEQRPNFHVSYQRTNLVWFKSSEPDSYIEFWKKNLAEIYQHKKEDVPKYLKWLADEKIIEISEEVVEKLDKKFYNTAMPVLNICPGFGFIFTIPGKKAEELDKKGELRKMILDAIKEGLLITGKDGDEFLKSNL
jgi:hypothetical protein